MIFVTGGAGFIGANFVLDWLAQTQQLSEPVVNLHKLTYAGNLQTLFSLDSNDRHHFVEVMYRRTKLEAGQVIPPSP